MSDRRLRPRAVALLLGGLLAPALLAGCGIRPTEVPVDAGAPASRTACPGEVLAPRAPDTASPSPAPGTLPAATARPSASPVPASPAPSQSPFTAPSPSASPSHCP
ncbi:hypothetical protein HUT16_13055 [Kitasatospora sp. NA04385]|uniref:hypothetical protein n=1 Tax=Kitasatospora sp. NA04385 TaxID=2742135 RepID=UPI001590E9F4|nr:hypothetical protein [Kitasatospora sp. NA04385]QKW19862.1 hypothetical protein HUT16_13055 [Kitasatospora sp. NA04385]